MFVYVFPYISLILLSFRDIFIKKYSTKNEKWLLRLLILYLIIIAGIRYGMGVDFFTYQNIFKGINRFQDLKYLEPGFRLIIVFLKTIGFSTQSLFLVFALITLYPLGRAIRKNSYYPLFSLYIYLCIFYTGYVFNGMRQAVAMSLFLLSIDSILNNKTWKVFLFTALSMSVHSSGIIILISYIFSKFKFKFNRKIFIFLLSISILFTFFNGIFAEKIVGIVPEAISRKIASYTVRFETSIDIIGLLQRVLILSPIILYYPMLKKVDDKFDILLRIYFLGFILYALFSFQGLFATRINMFLRILEVLILPYFFKLKLITFDRLIIFACIVLWASSVYFLPFSSNYYYPFTSIFT